MKELREKIKFDRDALDDAIEEQSGLFLEAADAHALAISDRDLAKSEMEQEFARACDRARNGEKKTEAAIKEAAQMDKKYKAAEKRYLDAKLNADYSVSLRESFDMRGKMLREMAQLFIAGYYQASSVSGHIRKEVDDRVASSNRAALNGARKRARLERERG
jgi:hypothetical protein